MQGLRRMTIGKGKRPSREKRDFMQAGREIVEKDIGEQMDGSPLPVEVDNRNPHAVALGSMGGKKGGKARARKLSTAKRHQIASAAARARWKK
jgi:hypothetical protein